MMSNAPSAEGFGVFVVEDDERMRAKLCSHIQQCEQLRVLGSAGSVAEALAWCASTTVAPRVLLTDLGLPDGTGISVIEAVVRRFPACEPLVLSMFGDEDHVLASIAAGALGYIQKDASSGDITQTILDLVAGAAPISPGIARRLLTRLRTTPATPTATPLQTASLAKTDTPGLSGREAEMLDLLARGFSYKEIAALRSLSSNTIASHVKSLYRKLNVSSRSEAVFEGLQAGIIASPHSPRG